MDDGDKSTPSTTPLRKRRPSMAERSSVTRNRRLEVFGFVVSALVIVVVTVWTLIASRIPKDRLDICEQNSYHYTKNITEDAASGLFPNGSIFSSDGLVYPPSAYWTRGGETWGCPCKVKPCVHKCCAEDQSHVIVDEITYDKDYGEYDHDRSSVCKRQNLTFSLKHSKVYSLTGDKNLKEVQIEAGHFHFIVKGPKCRKIILNVHENKNAFLLMDGRAYVNHSEYVKPFLNYSEFCVDSSNATHEINFKICLEDHSIEVVEENSNDWMFKVKAAGLGTSVPFLVATLVVYCILPQLKNLYGKSLVCHVACLAVGYALLTLINLYTHGLSNRVCTAIGYIIQFAILASFFWLNVMCFDIWWVFSGLMPLRGSQQSVERRKFRLYSAYAWSCPSVIVAISLFMDYAPGLPYYAIRPGMGKVSCMVKDEASQLLYIYLPIGVLVYLNILMFLTTAARFKLHSHSVKNLQPGDNQRHYQAGTSTSEIQRFSLYLKLFLVMGVNWVLELLSFAIGDDSVVWLICDLGNGLQGIVIFYVFVCKRSILRQLNLRLCPGLNLVRAEPSIGTTSSGRSTNSCKPSEPKFSTLNIEG